MADENKAPFIMSGDKPVQPRPSVIKRDSDIPAPVIMPMGSQYSYAAARNKKGYK